jgi:hypothetical protein
VVAELAPDGWEQSELLLVTHPTVSIRFAEATRFHNNIEHFISRRRKDDEKPSPAPTMEEIAASHKEEPVDAMIECAEIIGRCLWDIFSDNHDVIAPDGRIADIGSFRGAGGFIADWLNETLRDPAKSRWECQHYDYMDFYMGTVWNGSRADLSPVYRLIFRRLKGLGFEWRYSFPRLGVVWMGSPTEETPADGVGYDPSAALEKEQKEAKRREEFEKMQENLRASYNESVSKARALPPPEIVKAYMNVYGRPPEGWPPAADAG